MDLQTLSDRIAIEEKLTLWCTVIDALQPERLEEVFAPDVEWDFGEGTIDRSLDAVRARISRHLVQDTFCAGTQHNLSNFVIRINGDQAESLVNVTAAHAGKREYEGRTLLIWLTYNDQWTRRAEGWRVHKRTYRIQFMDGPKEIVYAHGPELWAEGDSRRLGR